VILELTDEIGRLTPRTVGNPRQLGRRGMRERLEADVRAQVMRSVAAGDPAAMGDLAAHLLESALRSENRLGLDEGAA
jgi:hypothetical protein